MADTQIDKLSLDINVRDHNSAEKINSVASAIRNLSKSLNGLKDVNRQMNQLQRMFTSLNKSVGKTTRGAKGSGPNVLKYIDVPDPEQPKGQFPKITGEPAERLKDVVKEQKEVGQSQKELDKETKKTTTGWNKFLKSIGRIALYRAIRAALKAITQAAKEGLENFRSVDTRLDDSLNKLSASSTTLKNSFAALLTPIIESITPAVVALGDGMARIANRINEAKAASQGLSTYTKILTSDTEEYQKSLKKTNGELLSFDTFTKLGKGDEYTGVKPEDVTMTTVDAANILTSFENIKNVALEIGAILLGWKIGTFIAQLKDSKELLGTLKTGTGILGSIVGISTALTNIIDLIKNWDDLSVKERIHKIGMAAIGILTAIASLIVMISTKGGAVVKIAAGIAAVGTIASIVGTAMSSAKNIQSYATGGSFNTADMFYANENGKTELVASTNAGGAVMNMEQLQSAIYNGMMLAMADSGNKEIVLKVDSNTLGRVVAQSTGFISETNRRNSGMKLI